MRNAPRAWALGALLFGASLALGCSPTDEPVGRERLVAAPAPLRIILLLSIDSLRPDHLGLYGYERFTSPVLDEVVRAGVIFEDASAAAPWTLPSHASMLTGLYPLRHRVVTSKTRLPAEVPTLAKLLAVHGFDTAAVVNSEWLKKENFQLTRDFSKYLWADTSVDRKAPNSWVTDQAIEWIEGLGEQPLFLFVHYYDLHSDYTSEPYFEALFSRPYEGKVDGTGWQLKQAVLEEDYIESCHRNFETARCSFGDEYVVDESVHRLHFDEADVRHLIDLYDAQIRQLDTELSRLFSALRRHGLLESTLLAVTSDHGEEFMEHGRVEHFIPTYQPVLRVPLMLRGPGVPAGLRVEAPVSSVDIVPTLLELARVPIPPGLDGLDLSPLWSGGGRQAFDERLMYGEAAGGIQYNFFGDGLFPVFRSVRQGRHKLVYESKGDTHALYDLEVDPGEKFDVSQSQPEVTARLMEAMSARYENFRPEPDAGNEAVLEPDDLERLRALGYVP